jgi:hypothetical protein
MLLPLLFVYLALPRVRLPLSRRFVSSFFPPFVIIAEVRPTVEIVVIDLLVCNDDVPDRHSQVAISWSAIRFFPTFVRWNDEQNSE